MGVPSEAGTWPRLVRCGRRRHPSRDAQKECPGGCEARVDSASIMPGLKSRPIAETSFSAACKAIWSPLKIAPTIFPLFKSGLFT